MATADDSRRPTGLPEGFVALPLGADQPDVPLRIAVLVRREADPAAGHLVVLRNTVDAQVLLGCITDAAGAVQRWLEIWIQNLESLGNTVAACREALSNQVLDERWTRHFHAAEQLDGPGLVRTGWETQHPLPTFVDVDRLRIVHPIDPISSTSWSLCQDDALLVEKGLPPYASSLFRYLCLPDQGADSPFVPVTPDAPTNENTHALDDILRELGTLVPVNPGGGLMLVREFCPIAYGDYVALLSGGSWDGVLHGRAPVHLGSEYRALRAGPPTQALAGRLFLGTQGQAGRLIETFHLKLRLLADALAAVRATTEHLERPLLNLTEDSFQVRLGQPAHGLPFLWTTRVALADPGDAVAPRIGSGGACYYLRAGAIATSVYRPATAGSPVQGTGTVRIRQVITGSRDTTVLEGTLVTQERIEPARLDLVWLRLNVGHRRLDAYAHLREDSALAAGEWRIRSVPMELTEEQIAALNAAEGVPFHGVPFQVIPLLSTPCDLYSLGVLAVRTLLVDSQTTLPVALDELLSLARQLAVEHDPNVDLRTRIQNLFAADDRWAASLGPQRLTHDELEPQAAFDLIPPTLWWDTLAALVRMFPGMGPDSVCRDFGDAPPGGIHKALDVAVADLDALLVRSRSLIVVDWRSNREIHAVIRSHLTGLASGATDGAAPPA